MSTDTATVLIPAPLRRFTNGEAKVTASGATVADLIANLEAAYPGIQERICEPDGRIRRFVNIFVNGANIRSGEGATTPVKAGDEVGIVPAMAGGR
jgi:molybdopterin synthase sulfur carrier subunit